MRRLHHFDSVRVQAIAHRGLHIIENRADFAPPVLIRHVVELANFLRLVPNPCVALIAQNFVPHVLEGFARPRRPIGNRVEVSWGELSD